MRKIATKIARVSGPLDTTTLWTTLKKTSHDDNGTVTIEGTNTKIQGVKFVEVATFGDFGDDKAFLMDTRSTTRNQNGDDNSSTNVGLEPLYKLLEKQLVQLEAQCVNQEQFEERLNKIKTKFCHEKSDKTTTHWLMP